MSQKLLSDRGWSGLLARLPGGFDLVGTARVEGAFVRARGVPSAEALLRLALVYANTSLSLRATSAWAAAARVALLSMSRCSTGCSRWKAGWARSWQRCWARWCARRAS